MSFIKSFTCLLALALSTSTSTAFAWGASGHQLIAFVGGKTTVNGQEFWASNLESLRVLSNVPDRLWKDPSTKSLEASNHWFQADYYYLPEHYEQISLFPSSFEQAVSKYTEEVVVKNGTAPWRIRQLYQLAVNAFRIKNYPLALQYVGTMSHYIGDLSQPLHVTENYDGEETHNEGIHMFFETQNIGDEQPQRLQIESRTQKLLNDPAFLSQFNGSLMDILLHEIKRSIAMKDLILNTDTKYGRSLKGEELQFEIAMERIADGAATFSLILNRLWIEAGIDLKASPMTIQDPKWIKNDFSGFKPVNTSPMHGDDCAH